jgi:hypothetical protein
MIGKVINHENFFVENFKLNDQGMKKSDLAVCLELPESQLYHALSLNF